MLDWRRMKGLGRRNGQAALEYILVFVALLGLYFAARWFASAARRTAVQTAEIVTSDSP